MFRLLTTHYFHKLSIALALLLFLSGYPLAASGDAADKQITVAMDDKTITLPISPYQQNGVIMVPLRNILEALQMKIVWNQQQQQMTATIEQTKLIVTLHSKQAYINDRLIPLPQAPSIINGTMMAPLQLLSALTENTVYWNSNKQHIDIISKQSLQLFKAAYYDDTSILKHRLQQGDTIDSLYQGLTPLLWATMGNAANTASVLLQQKANPNVTSPTNWTPLLWAAYHQNDKMIASLIQSGAEPTINSSTNQADLRIAQTNLTRYLNSGSSKVISAKQIKDSYMNIPLGSSKATVKATVKTKLLIDDWNLLQYEQRFIDGKKGIVQYEFKNNKLTSVIYLVKFDFDDASHALDQFFAQIKRLEQTYHRSFDYKEHYSPASAAAQYESMNDDLYQKYDLAMWRSNLKLANTIPLDNYEITFMLDFLEGNYEYIFFLLYE